MRDPESDQKLTPESVVKVFMEGAAPKLKAGGLGLMVFSFRIGSETDLTMDSSVSAEDTAALLVAWLGTNEPEVLAQSVKRWQAQQLLGPGVERPQ